MTLRGDLQDLSVPEILHVVGAARRAGLLRIVLATGETAHLLIRDATVVALRGGGMPATLEDLLREAGSLDPQEQERARALAESESLTMDEALARTLGDPLRMRRALEARIEACLPPLMEAGAGTFEFSLVEPSDPRLADFGALVLTTGIPVKRAGARQATIARPAAFRRQPAPAAAPEPRPSPPPPAPGPSPSRAGAAVLHCLEAGPLRQGLLSSLAAAGVDARAVTSSLDVRAGVLAARERGDAVALACHADHGTLPGLELLARLRSVDAGVPAIVLVDGTSPVPRRAVIVERAATLGARLIGQLDEGDPAAVAADVADRIVRLVRPEAPPQATPPSPAPEPSGPECLLPADLPAGRPPTDEDLAVLARTLAVAGEAADLVREILAVIGAHFERCSLWAQGADGLEPLGIVGTRGELPPALRAGAIPSGSEDFLSVAVRSGMPRDGEPPAASEADATLLAALDASSAARVAVVPLLAGGACFGAACATDDGLAPDADVAGLSRFLMEAAPSLQDALGRERRRLEARRARAST